MHNSFLHLLLKNGDFLNTYISQGSVATHLGRGGYMYMTVTNFLLSLTVKEFWKSVNIWWSYGQELGVLFFDSRCIISDYFLQTACEDMLQQICHGLFNATLNYNKNTIWIDFNFLCEHLVVKLWTWICWCNFFIFLERCLLWCQWHAEWWSFLFSIKIGAFSRLMFCGHRIDVCFPLRINVLADVVYGFNSFSCIAF